jgi:hypothetical protein
MKNQAYSALVALDELLDLKLQEEEAGDDRQTLASLGRQEGLLIAKIEIRTLLMKELELELKGGK